MQNKMRAFFFLLLLLSTFVFSQNLNFQIDVITHMNTASQFWVENNRIYAATSGGLFIYNLDNDKPQTYTSVDGIYNHHLTAIANSQYNLLALGSLNGYLTFFDVESKTFTNDENLKGTEIVDISSIEDTLWVLSKDFVSVYLYSQEQKRYQFRESYQEFGTSVGDFRAIEYANGRIWLANETGLVSAPGNFLKYNLYAGSNWRVQTTAQGLPGNVINDIVKGGSGELIYLATNRGISKYDFNSFSNITNGLVALSLTHLALRDGEIYAADSRRVYRLVSEQFELIYTSPHANITDLAVDIYDDVWISTQKRGLRNITDSKRIRIDGPLDNYIGEVYVDQNRRVWASSATLGTSPNRGIFVETENGWANFYFFGGTNNRYVSLNSSGAIMEDAGQNIWIGSWGGGAVLFDNDLNFYPINKSTNSGSVWTSSIAAEDTVGVETLPELNNILFPALGSGDFVVITDFWMDSQRQSIWVLNYLPSNRKPLVEYTFNSFTSNALDSTFWKHFGGPFGKNELHKITQDPFGDLWFATSEGVVQVRMDGDNLASEKYDESDGLKINSVWSIAADEDGYVWVGTRSGLNAILNRTVFDFRGTYQPIGLKINDIYVDSRNNKWFASDKGLSILKASDSPFDPNSWVDIVPFSSSIDPEQLGQRANVFKENLPSENIHSVFLDETTGDVYVGTDAGIAIIRNNPFASIFSDYEQLQVGPNPFVLEEDRDNLFSFFNLVANSEIKILTINGQLVRALDPKNFSENKGAMAQWDGRTEEGKFVSSGVYLYLMSNEEGQSKAGKVLVIRK
jgi:ligand-binding sensor domain-containing protein